MRRRWPCSRGCKIAKSLFSTWRKFQGKYRHLLAEDDSNLCRFCSDNACGRWRGRDCAPLRGCRRRQHSNQNIMVCISLFFKLIQRPRQPSANLYSLSPPSNSVSLSLLDSGLAETALTKVSSWRTGRARGGRAERAARGGERVHRP